MRKLTPTEAEALHFLRRVGSACPGEPTDPVRLFVRSVLDSLVKKKRATVEMTDDGHRYTITQAGIADAS
jgi:hypothetical protein